MCTCKHTESDIHRMENALSTPTGGGSSVGRMSNSSIEHNITVKVLLLRMSVLRHTHSLHMYPVWAMILLHNVRVMVAMSKCDTLLCHLQKYVRGWGFWVAHCYFLCILSALHTYKL